jgi:hypothetical protein
MYVSMAKKYSYVKHIGEENSEEAVWPITEQEVWRNRTKGIMHNPLSGSKY